MLDGVTQIGQFNVIAINLGTREGIESGHIFRVYQDGAVVKDTVSGKRYTDALMASTDSEKD